jgi:hypothetical protein
MTRNTLLGNLFIILLAGGCSAAELTIGAAPAGNGQTAEFEVQFTPDSSALAALQFDVGFNPTLVKLSATAGRAAMDAHKDLVTASAGPGKMRFLIVGLNRESISKGVVVRLSVTVLDANKTGDKTLVLSNAAGADREARRVQIEVRNGDASPGQSPSSGTVVR